MNKTGKKIIEGITSFGFGVFITTIMAHWFGANIPENYNMILNFALTPLTTAISYAVIQDLKVKIKRKYPELAEELSEIFDFEEKKSPPKKGKENKLHLKTLNIVENSDSIRDMLSNVPVDYFDAIIRNILPNVPANYFDAIIRKAKDTDVTYESEEITKINQFLNFIEYNYDLEIKRYNAKLSNDKIIELILTQICLYSKQTNTNSFTESDVDRIINNCFFIPQDLKKQIKRKYRLCIQEQAKLTYEDHQEYIESSEEIPPFGINDLDYYKCIISNLEKEGIFERHMDPGNIQIIKWDLKLLRYTIQTIFQEFGEELIGIENIELKTSMVVNKLIYGFGLEAIREGSFIVYPETILRSISKEENLFSQDQKKHILLLLNEELVNDLNIPWMHQEPKKYIKKDNIIPFPNAKSDNTKSN